MSPQVPTKDIVSIRCYFQELIKGMDITAFVPPDTDQVLAGSAGSARPGRWAVPNRAFCPSKHGRIFCSRQCRVQHQNQMKRQSIPKTHLIPPLLSPPAASPLHREVRLGLGNQLYKHSTQLLPVCNLVATFKLLEFTFYKEKKKDSFHLVVSFLIWGLMLIIIQCFFFFFLK